MATNYGFAGLNVNQNSTTDGGIQEILERLGVLELKVQTVRVRDIILDDTHPKFGLYGEWNGIGTIEFEELNNVSPSTIDSATPLLPNIGNYPLVNETVLIFLLDNKEKSKSQNAPPQYFYLNPVSNWNHPHHNAVPNPIISTSPSSQDVGYKEMERGVSQKVDSNPFELNLNPPSGGTFVERENIHPILPFMGDNIIEGRFGNSIRLGNTSKTKSILYQNNWSSIGNNGDPITIIRNGQDPKLSNQGWIPTIENVNRDLSSVYLTSTQRIPLKSEFPSFPTLLKNPSSLTEYSKNQIILSSGRLVFNSKGDSIFLTSNNSISLNSTEDIALFSRNSNIALQGKEVKLGEKSAGEPIILGNKFMEGFDQLLFSLSILGEALLTEPCFTGASATAANMKQTADEMRSQLKDYLSKTVKSV